MEWETVMGLEIHAELATKSKIFCGCTTHFGGEPNTHVCPVCAGFPGVLPVLNRSVVEFAMRVGIALDCAVAGESRFDRKNYFYPDLPKAYQVSQLYAPICRDGFIEIAASAPKKITIREIHIEEDAGKLIHAPECGGTFMDFNRCGVPLIEIVTEPDFHETAEVIAFLEKLRETLLFLDVCDCKMQEGSLRVDVNLSVRKTNEPMGVRTETKNLNSFKSIARAIEYEKQRQIDILRRGGEITQETRRWDESAGESYSMRSKENAPDYRYFPEPDLLPIVIDDKWIEQTKKNMPELAYQKRERYAQKFLIPKPTAAVLTVHKNISALFETVAEKTDSPIETANLITGEIMRLMSVSNTTPETLSLDAEKLATLITLVLDGKINRTVYKETAEAVFMLNVEPETYITEKGLMMSCDNDLTAEAVRAVLCENPDAVSDYFAGKDKVFGFLMGRIMKKLGKGGNPDIAKKKLNEELRINAPS